MPRPRSRTGRLPGSSSGSSSPRRHRPDDGLPRGGRVDPASRAGGPFLGRGCRDAVVAGLVDLVEALVAAGDKKTATVVVDELARRTDGLVDPLGRALVGRCRPSRAGWTPTASSTTPYPSSSAPRRPSSWAVRTAPGRAPAALPATADVPRAPHGSRGDLHPAGSAPVGRPRTPRADRVRGANLPARGRPDHGGRRPHAAGAAGGAPRWPAGCPTPRSAARCSSVRRRSSSTSGRSTGNSA